MRGHLDLDFHFDTRRQFKLHERIDGTAVRIQDINKPLMRTNFELLAAFLIDVGRAIHSIDRLLRRQRYWPRNHAACGLNGSDDFLRALIDQVMIVRLQLNSNLLHKSLLYPLSLLFPRDRKQEAHTMKRYALP